MNKQEPTQEQYDFINFDGEESVILKATAGSGKSKSFVDRLNKMLADGIDPSRVIFFSFTNDAVEELRTRINAPVRITTIHSYTSSQLGKMNKFKPIVTFYMFASWYKENFKPKGHEPIKKRMAYQNNINKFYEDGSQISAMFSAYKLQTTDSVKVAKPKFYDEYKKFLFDTKSRDFSDLLIETERLSKNPQYIQFFEGTYDYVFIDEYQDTSTMQLKILLSIKAKQYYLAGDENQCLTGGSNILTDSGYKKIEDLETGDKVLSAMGGNNLDYRKITKIVKSDIYTGDLIELKTKSGKIIKTTPSHTHFGRFSLVNENKYLVYLMYKEGVGYRMGKTEIYPKRVADNDGDRLGFKIRINQEHADKLWVINSYSTLNDALIAEDLYSLIYQIPKNVFVARQGQSQDHIDRLFNEFDSHSMGIKILKQMHYSFHQPHYTPKSKKDGLTNMSLQLCTDGRGKQAGHSLEINGCNDYIKEYFESNGYKTTDNGKGTGWRIRRTSVDYSTLTNAITLITDKVNLILTAKFTDKTYLQLPAAQMVPGMDMMIYEDGKIITDEVIERNIIKCVDQTIFDIDVEGTHNFIVDGIITHNSIFGFSGANCDAIEALLNQHKPVIKFTLSKNFRSKVSLVEHSNTFSNLQAVPHSTEEGILELPMIDEDTLQDMMMDDDPLAVLVRTNKVIKELEKKCLKKKIKLRYFNYFTPQDLELLKGGDKNINPSIKKKLEAVAPYFGSNQKMIQFIEENQNSESFITSIHKSKGREYPRVVVVNSFSPEQLMDSPDLWEDYSFINSAGEEDIESRNVHYVACTRAKNEQYFLMYDE